MGAQADVTADDLVSSLLHSITSGSGSAASSSSSSSSSASSASSSSTSASASSSASSSGSSSAPAATTAAPVATTAAPSTPTPTTSVRGVDNGDASSDSGGSGAAVGIGLAMAALVMAAVVLLYLRRRKRIKAMKQRRDQFGGVDELGPAQPSIELPAPKRPLYRPSQDPGVRGSSMYSSSSSSRDGTSVFHTVGGLSPTSRKLGSQFRASSISSVDSVNLQAPAGATTSGRKLQRVMSGREMDENDELQYEQLKSTAANARVLDDRPTPLRLSNVSSVNSLHDSMSSDKYAHGDGLGATTAAAAPPQQQEPDRQQLSQALDSSLITGRTKRTGSVYDSIPALAGEQMTSEAPPTPAASGEAVTPAMGRRPPPPPPPAGVQAFQPMTEGGSYVAALPGGLTSFANADDLEFSMDAQMRLDAPSERASTMSTTSTDSGCTTRSGSLIGVVATSDADEIQI